MPLFKKILYPTDLSKNSIELMTCVLELARTNKAELIILYTYLLKNHTESPKRYLSFKQDMEKKVVDTFNKISQGIPKVSEINYSLVTEVGLVDDRIISQVETHKVDLVVLSRSLQKQLESKDNLTKGVILPELRCPILILPPCSQQIIEELGK